MSGQILHNKKILEANRKQLRNFGTPAEATLWKALKGSQLEGRKFRRQHSVGSYILDFYCPAERLAIELDGAGHFSAEAVEADRIRDEFLVSHRIHVLRFENKLVFENLESVLGAIRNDFQPPPAPP
jgi:very-short-patch-repair endonuclease